MSEIDRLVQIVVAHPEGPGLESTAETIVRAILQAMREPSEGMLEAGRDVDRWGNPPLAEQWQAMIDHILAD